MTHQEEDIYVVTRGEKEEEMVVNCRKDETENELPEDQEREGLSCAFRILRKINVTYASFPAASFMVTFKLFATL